MFILSLVLHLVILLICTRTDLFQAERHEVTPYYVDIVSLPTVEPAPGAGQTTSAPPAPPQAPQPPPAPAKPAMSLPVKTATTPVQKPQPIPPPASNQEAREFSERMSRLEHTVEGKHEAAALESLQKRVAAKSRGGGPVGSGTTPGYDYAAYIQSRLKDALATTMVFRSKRPEASVQIYIDKRGKLLRYVMIKPSSDKLFNDSVIRTIEKAKADFPPTPTGADFDKLYVFSPQEVSKK
jgi:colicin import membrane protein